MRKILLMTTLLVLTAAVATNAAWFEPALEDQLLAAGDNETVRALILLENRLDLGALLADLDAEQADFDRRHYAVITACQEHNITAQESLLEFLTEHKRQDLVESFRPFWIANAIAVQAQPAFFELLRTRDDIGWIYLDEEIELIYPVRVAPAAGEGRGVEVGIEIARAPELWGLGIDGTGVITADMDTGCDGSHPAFADRWRGLVADPSECWYDPAQGTSFPYDSGSHGTHTMGTMIGDDGGDNQIGMAPGAQWIAAAVVDVPGVSIYTEAIAAFEWFADPDGNPATTDDVPAVINNSWGIRGTPHCSDHFWDAIDVSEAAGVAVVFAAGNEGPMGYSLRSPADRIASEFDVFSVGALKPNGTRITNFSSRGPSRCDWQTIKPEVSAVGEEVRSSVPNNGYSTMDGTSMASPHVSGAIVLLRQAYPDATVEELKMALYYTAVDLGDVGEDNKYGRGRIDVMAAYEFLIDMCDNDNDSYEKISCGGDDCDDYDPAVHPGAEELCDGKDNVCAGQLPDDEIDHDSDGWMECAGDCEPNNPDVHPNHQEICDGIDNNCDDELLEDEIDPDNDGVMNCEGDCGPDNPDVYPGAEELCDGLDTNCDTHIPYEELDIDQDGFLACADDCHDSNPYINPDADEDCGDMIDNDCDGLIDYDDPECVWTDDDAVDDDLVDDDIADDDMADDDLVDDDAADDDAGDDDDDDGCGV